mgnify:CR=1 FL=1
MKTKTYRVRWHTDDSSVVRATSKKEASQMLIDYPEDNTEEDRFGNIVIDDVEEEDAPFLSVL